MSEPGIVQPSLPPDLPPRPAPAEIAPTIGMESALAWARAPASRARWPFWFVPPLLAAGVAFSLVPVSDMFESLLRTVGPWNVIWFFGLFIPTTIILAYASARCIRFAAAVDRKHQSAFYIAWASAASWKPDLAAQGAKELGALRERRTETREALRHLIWILWGVSVGLVITLGGTIAMLVLHRVTIPGAARATAVCFLALASTLWTASRLSSYVQSHGPNTEDIDRANALHQECNQEKQRWYRFPFSRQ